MAAVVRRRQRGHGPFGGGRFPRRPFRLGGGHGGEAAGDTGDTGDTGGSAECAGCAGCVDSGESDERAGCVGPAGRLGGRPRYVGCLGSRAGCVGRRGSCGRRAGQGGRIGYRADRDEWTTRGPARLGPGPRHPGCPLGQSASPGLAGRIRWTGWARRTERPGRSGQPGRPGRIGRAGRAGRTWRAWCTRRARRARRSGQAGRAGQAGWRRWSSGRRAGFRLSLCVHPARPARRPPSASARRPHSLRPHHGPLPPQRPRPAARALGTAAGPAVGPRDLPARAHPAGLPRARALVAYARAPTRAHASTHARGARLALLDGRATPLPRQPPDGPASRSPARAGHPS